MSRNMGPCAEDMETVERRFQIRHLDRDYLTERRVDALQWAAHGHLFEIDLDARQHMTDGWDRDHFGSFVMPCESELNAEDFAHDPNFDPFIGEPSYFNGPPAPSFDKNNDAPF